MTSPSPGPVQSSSKVSLSVFSFSHDLSIFALATREDNAIFSSFVNCVVLATIHAQEMAITKEASNFMSLKPWFGRDFDWALRDVILHREVR